MTAFDIARLAAGYCLVVLIVWTSKLIVGF